MGVLTWRVFVSWSSSQPEEKDIGVQHGAFGLLFVILALAQKSPDHQPPSLYCMVMPGCSCKVNDITGRPHRTAREVFEGTWMRHHATSPHPPDNPTSIPLATVAAAAATAAGALGAGAAGASAGWRGPSRMAWKGPNIKKGPLGWCTFQGQSCQNVRHLCQNHVAPFWDCENGDNLHIGIVIMSDMNACVALQLT